MRARRRSTPTSSSSPRASGRRRCTLVRSGEEAFCIDSPVLPGRARDPARDRRAGAASRVVGLLATHADWDHLLGRYAFPEAPLGVRRDDRGAAARRARRARSASCATSTRSTTSSARGRCRCRRRRRCRCRAAARSATQRARAAPGRRPHRRRDGDLDPVGARARVRRLPLAGRDPVAVARAARASAYLATLDRLEPLVEAAEHVVPGHGAPLDAGARGGDPARGPRRTSRALRATRTRAAARAADRRAEQDPRGERRADLPPSPPGRSRRSRRRIEDREPPPARRSPESEAERAVEPERGARCPRAVSSSMRRQPRSRARSIAR